MLTAPAGEVSALAVSSPTVSGAVGYGRELVCDAGENDKVHKPQSAPPFGLGVLRSYLAPRTDDGLYIYRVLRKYVEWLIVWMEISGHSSQSVGIGYCVSLA